MTAPKLAQVTKKKFQKRKYLIRNYSKRKLVIRKWKAMCCSFKKQTDSFSDLCSDSLPDERRQQFDCGGFGPFADCLCARSHSNSHWEESCSVLTQKKGRKLAGRKRAKSARNRKMKNRILCVYKESDHNCVNIWIKHKVNIWKPFDNSTTTIIHSNAWSAEIAFMTTACKLELQEDCTPRNWWSSARIHSPRRSDPQYAKQEHLLSRSWYERSRVIRILTFADLVLWQKRFDVGPELKRRSWLSRSRVEKRCSLNHCSI